MIALHFRNVAVCKLLLGTRGINVDIRNNSGHTALNIAIQQNLTEITNLLIGQGAMHMEPKPLGGEIGPVMRY